MWSTFESATRARSALGLPGRRGGLREKYGTSRLRDVVDDLADGKLIGAVGIDAAFTQSRAPRVTDGGRAA